MPAPNLRIGSELAFAALLSCLGGAASAQPAGLLYDLEPPADSAYVRVILASRDGAVAVKVDGKPRGAKLVAGTASDYMVLTAGKHMITLQPVDKNGTPLTASIDVVQGRAMTVAFTALRTDTAPILFEDKTNANKLKALLSVYRLDSGNGALDILSADGATKVFSGLATGTSAAISVNPISIELIATKAGEKAAQASASLAMAQGGTYSILLVSGQGGKLVAHSMQNKIERYTGK